MKCVVIGSVWPEPNSSAAGENMMALLRDACQRDWQVIFATASQHSEHAFDLTSLGIKTHEIRLNCSSFDTLIAQINPDLVIFDRFMTEEQFAWRVAKVCPNALRVLNTEDLHGLRQARKVALTNANAAENSNDVMLRELAAILRSDITLIISRSEIDWLEQHANMPASQLYYMPLVAERNIENATETKGFEQRSHVSFIGNFRHQPNWHAVLKLHQLWPQIQKQLKGVECHIFGAYPPKKATELNNSKSGFIVKGWVENADDAFTDYRLALAPLTFGAGVKGKMLRAIATATPSVASPVAIDGISDETHWPGIVAHSDSEFVDAVVSLYRDKEHWITAQHRAATLQQKLTAGLVQREQFYLHCESVFANLAAHRQQHLLSQVVNHQTLKSHQYMSQWIEAKNTTR